MFLTMPKTSLAQLQYSPNGYMDTTTVAFSPDGKLILSAGFHGNVRLWKTESCALESIMLIHDPRILPDHPDINFPAYLSVKKGILSLAWSPDGNKFVIGLRDRTLRLYSIIPIPEDSGSFWFEELKVFGASLGLRAVAYSPNGQFIASAGHDNKVEIWDVEKLGSSVKQFCCHDRQINSLDFSPDSNYVLSGSGDGTFKVWEISKETPSISFNVNDAIYSVKFSPDMKWIAVSTDSYINENEIVLWDMDSGKEKWRFNGHSGAVWSMSFSPNGRYLASGGIEDGKIIIWDLGSGKPSQILMEKEERSVRSLSYSPDGRFLVSGVTSGGLPLWDIQTGKIVREYGKCSQ